MDTARVVLEVGGRGLSVLLRRSGSARRMSLRVLPSGEGVVLVLPMGARVADGLDFARSKAGWIENRLVRLPERVPFEEGAVVPLLGVPHTIRHRPDARRGVWAEEDILHISGRPEHLSRRLADWLKREARDVIAPRAHLHAATLGKQVNRISLRDPRSRWGSCTSGGDLSFSWRLVLAPLPVLEYVVAHEVAHLVEMNHSEAFWRIVAGLVPDVGASRSWLRSRGGELHRFGPLH